MHYTDADLQAIQAQQKKRWLLLGIIILVFLAGMIVSFIFRIEWMHHRGGRSAHRRLGSADQAPALL